MECLCFDLMIRLQTENSGKLNFFPCRKGFADLTIGHDVLCLESCHDGHTICKQNQLCVGGSFVI